MDNVNETIMGEDCYPSQEVLSVALSSKNLELIVLPTEDCNFRCTYCYEDHIPGRMSHDTVTGIKKLIDRRMDDLNFLRLSWFGGEPLITKDIVFEVSEFAHRRCQEKGVEISGDMTTNGYLLTKDVMTRLVAANQTQFFVSLAGIGANHDQYRPLASGKGTFDRIWGNLIELQDSTLDFTMNLRLHFGPDIAMCEELCSKVNQQFAGDSRFSFAMQRIADLGGEYSGQFATISAEEAQPIVLRLASLLPDVQADQDQNKGFICCAARPNNFIIRANGQICRCACHLNDPKTQVGHLDSDGRMNIDRQLIQPWFKGYDHLDSRMLSCPYVSVPENLWPQDKVKTAHAQ